MTEQKWKMVETHWSGRAGTLRLARGRSALGTHRQSTRVGTLWLARAHEVASAHAGVRALSCMGARGVRSVGRTRP
jgi:hypothetical protein